MGVEPWDSQASGWADAHILAMKPAAAISETYPARAFGGAANLAGILVSQRLHLVAIPIQAGRVITNISFMSGDTALAAATNHWFSLHRADDRVLLRQTVNAGAAAWAANTVKTLALTATYTPDYTGMAYLGIMVQATTVPTLSGLLCKSQANAIAPITSGSSTAALTTTAPNPAAALTAQANQPWGWTS